MATAVKRKLSGSTAGMGIKIAQTATLGTTIHVSTSETIEGSFDEIWLWAYNSHSEDVLLTIEFGDAVAPTHNISVTIPKLSGLVPVVPGLILQDSKTVTAFAAVGDVVTLSGFVNRMTD